VKQAKPSGDHAGRFFAVEGVLDGTISVRGRFRLDWGHVDKNPKMKSTTNRFALRDLTRAHHAQLDAEVGSLDDHDSYVRYLIGMAAFREAIEPQLRRAAYPVEFGGWRPTLISAELLGDMRDLGVGNPAPEIAHPIAPSLSALMGVLYVVEGSTLGARVLVKRARQLHFGAAHGARHLHAQLSNPESWIVFQQILQEIEPFDVDVAAKSACDTFHTAYQAFRRIRHAAFPG